MKDKPNYLEDILKKSKELGPGIFHIEVLHDDLCDYWNNKPCNCNVETNIKKEN